MRYTVMANTGTSLWPVDETETSPEVEAYLMSQSGYRLEIQSGAAGIYQAPSLAEKLSHLVSDELAGTFPGTPEVHSAAIRSLLDLMRMVTTHHGASIVVATSMVIPPDAG